MKSTLGDLISYDAKKDWVCVPAILGPGMCASGLNHKRYTARLTKNRTIKTTIVINAIASQLHAQQCL